MNIIKTAIKTIVLCFIVYIIAAFVLIPKDVSAETLENGFVMPDSNYNWSVSADTITQIVNSIYENQSVISAGYNKSNSYYFLNYNSYNQKYDTYLVLVDDMNATNTQYRYWYNGRYTYCDMILFDKCLNASDTATNLSTVTFESKTSVPSGNSTSFGIVDYVTNPWGFSRYHISSMFSSDGYYSSLSPEQNRGIAFGTYYIPPYVPSQTGSYYSGISLAINQDDFYNFLINTEKYKELPSYIGSEKLRRFIEFYNDFGGSNTTFFHKIGEWFKHMNIVSQPSDNINILKTTMDDLYEEYLTQFTISGYSNSANQAHHRRNVETNTTDTNTSLITDDANDSLIESLLRDILRGVISIQTSIADQTETIVRAIKNLTFNQTIVNNGGTGQGLDANTPPMDDAFADTMEQPPTIDKTVPDLLSAPAVIGNTVNVYINIFRDLGIDNILIFAVLLCFIIVKIRGNTK